MDHKDAIRTNAIEKYWLGELPANERLEFEEHFFGCAHCAEELLTTQVLVENARAVLKENGAKSAKQKTWFRWLLTPIPVWAPACVVLALLAVVVPRYRNGANESTVSRVVTAVALHPMSRGEPQVVSLPLRTSTYLLTLDIGEPSTSGYECEIRNAVGQFRVRIGVPVTPKGGQLNLLVNAQDTPPGDYVLTLRETTGQSEAGQYRFTVQRQGEEVK
jgi:putative zinc finger protein